jgi:hypothetical protein
MQITLTPLLANRRRIEVIDEMNKLRKQHRWAEHTELQKELEKLNIILFGTPAPGHNM